jgi:spermidine synthase
MDENGLVFSCHDEEGVIEVVDDFDTRALYFGTSARQSAMSHEEPHRLVLSYTRAMLSGLLFTGRPRSALVLGLGGGSLPRFLMHVFPTCRIDVVERRAKVARVAHDYFQLARSPRLRTHLCDAAVFLREDGRTYDLVLVDLHDPKGTAPLVTEAGFFASCARRLAPRGVFAINLWADPSESVPPALMALTRPVAWSVTRSIADEPDAVDVEMIERRGEVSILVHADKGDMGRLIGRRGRVVQALRQVTRAAGAAEGIKASVDIVE